MRIHFMPKWMDAMEFAKAALNSELLDGREQGVAYLGGSMTLPAYSEIIDLAPGMITVRWRDGSLTKYRSR